MKTVAIEDLIISTILTFCENAAELGCPKDKDVDMWFRELSYEDGFKMAGKLMDIQERDAKMAKIEKTEKVKDKEEVKEKEIKMIEIEIDMEDNVVEGVVKYAMENIKNDRQALINYGVNKILEEIVRSNGKCLGEKCQCKQKITKAKKTKKTKTKKTAK